MLEDAREPRPLPTERQARARAGLGLVSIGMRAGLALTAIVSLVSTMSLVGALLVLAFPETGSHELEEISERNGARRSG